MFIVRYSHVMHIASRVTGKLRADKDCLDLFRSTFPAGTVSGAPKIRAMEIIDELEPSRRGIYAGGIGYIDFSGTMDMCIAIRTMIINGNRLYFQAGAGIVADSVAENEYQETLNKARALLQSLSTAEGILS
jgi:anthranilate synthase component 1